MVKPSIPTLVRIGLTVTVLVGTVVLAAACSDATAPGASTIASTIAAFRTTGTIPVPVPVVHVDADAIRVDGEFATPTPCYSLSSRASVSHDTLVVGVVAHSTLRGAEVCVQMVQPWLYTVAVTGVPYDLVAIRITHQVGGHAETVVLEEPISVP